MGTQDDEGFEFDTRAVRAGSMQSNFQECIQIWLDIIKIIFIV